MANAKTYNELNQTSAINASDLVAVAQSDKTELQKTTVSDLASAVGELNQAGALAELSLATSIGKNLLAQRLNEKGVQDITPNNTLIEMADAVDKLQTVNEVDQIRGLVSNESDSSTGYGSYTMSDQHARLFRNIETGDMIVLTGGTMSYIPYGKYNSVQELFAATTHTIDVSDSGTGYTFSREYGMYAISEDFTKILVTLNNSGLRRIYSVSKEAGFTLIKEFTKVVTEDPKYTGYAIRNDGRYIIYGSKNKQLSVYDTITDNDYLLNFPTSESLFSYLAKVLMKDSNIYFIGRTDGANYDSLVGKVSYIVKEDGAVTFGSPEVNQHGPRFSHLTSAEWLHKPGEDTSAPILWNFAGTEINSIPNVPLVRMMLNVLSLDSTLVSIPKKYDLNIIPLNRRADSRYDLTSSIFGIGAGKLEFTAGEYIFKSVALSDSLHIDKSTGTISTITTGPVYATVMPSLTNTDAWNTAIYSNPDTGFYIFCDGSTNDNYKIGNIHYTSYNLDKDKYVFGYKKQKNNAIVYYLPIINHATLDTGACDLTTKQVEI